VGKWHFCRRKHPAFPSDIPSEIDKMARVYADIICKEFAKIVEDMPPETKFSSIKILYHPTSKWKELYEGNAVNNYTNNASIFRKKCNDEIIENISMIQNIEKNAIYIEKYSKVTGKIARLNIENVTENAIDEVFNL
jgi:hypothetical protein